MACHVAACRSAAIVQQTGNQNWNKGKSESSLYLKISFRALKPDLGKRYSQNWCIPVNFISSDSAIFQDGARATNYRDFFDKTTQGLERADTVDRELVYVLN